MSVSALFGSRIAVAPAFPAVAPSLRKIRAAPLTLPVGSTGLVIECSSRPQKKGTKHHMKTRPRKTQLWDIKRKPTVYAPLPPLPPEWSLVSSDTAAETATTADGGSAQAPPQS